MIEPLIIHRSPFAIGRWLKYPAALLFSVLFLLTGLTLTGALRVGFIVALWFLLLPASVGLLWLNYQDWYDESYVIDEDGEITLKYRTIGKYDTQRKGSLHGLRDSWVVRRGLFNIITNTGDVYLQVSWSRLPFILRDVRKPYQMSALIKERAQALHTAQIPSAVTSYLEGLNEL